MESSVLDQLRLQEGRLFQSESVLALYLDVKAVMNEVLSKSTVEKKEALETLSEDFLSSLESTLKVLGPKGIHDYHNQSLNECMKLVARLLWPSEHLLVARPLLTTLFKGLCKRITSSENYAHYHALDPIKQDYVIREAFRRCLVNDCLVVFPTQLQEDIRSVESVDSMDRPVGAQSIRPREDRANEKEDSEEAIEQSPEDDIHESVSVAQPIEPVEAPKSLETKAHSVAPSVARSVVQSRAPSVALSSARKMQSNLDDMGSVVLIDMPKDLKDSKHEGFELRAGYSKSVVGKSIVSEMPKVTSAEDKSMRSGYSAVSAATTSTLRRPLNVRKVLLETEEK